MIERLLVGIRFFHGYIAELSVEWSRCRIRLAVVASYWWVSNV